MQDDFPLFYFNVEQDNYLNYILYSDTDSMFMQLMDNKQLKELFGIEELNKETVSELDEEFIQPLSKKLNEILKNIWSQKILARANVTNDEYNKLDFKTEMVLNFILYGNKKKRYVYSILKEKAKTFDKPKIQIKGFELTRSDTSKFVKDLQMALIETFIENEDVKQLINTFKQVIREYQDKLKRAVEEFDIEYIGIPKNWSAREYKKDPSYVLGAKFYNTFIQDRIRPGTKGLIIPIEFIPFKFKKYVKEFLAQNIDKTFHEYQIDIKDEKNIKFILEKVTFIFIPPEYNKEKIKEFFEKAGIKISLKSLYSSSFETKIEPFKQLLIKQKNKAKKNKLF
jgi:DNA polymerase elongation subunit (family B)